MVIQIPAEEHNSLEEVLSQYRRQKNAQEKVRTCVCLEISLETAKNISSSQISLTTDVSKGGTVWAP